MAKNKKIDVQGTSVSLFTDDRKDFISLTDIARYRHTERSDYILQNWMRNRSTIEFIGLWELFNNPCRDLIVFRLPLKDGLKQLNNIAIAQMKSLVKSKKINRLNK